VVKLPSKVSLVSRDGILLALPRIMMRGIAMICFPAYLLRTIHSPLEGPMFFKGAGSSSRKLVWVEKETFKGWGCSECAWVFNPSAPPIGESLDAIKRNSELQFTQEFATHPCAERRRAKRETNSP
jgi:rubredoxin